MNKLKIRTTKVYDDCEKAYSENYPIMIEEGGSRSSKTYNILIWLIQKSLTEWENKIIDVCRKAFPSLRDTVMFDFFEILRSYNLYNIEKHNRTEHIYNIGSNRFRFFGLDQEQKVRGRKRDIIFINEANELNEDDFKQLNQRTTELTIIDYNPSTEFGWYYDIQERDSVITFHSTYKDNPFLEERIKKQIEEYKQTDENYWRVFGLGLRGVSKTTIFTHWKLTEEFKGEGETLFGMDFGFNHPTTLTRVKYDGKNIIAEELLYKSELTSESIINELEKLEEKGYITKQDKIIADSSRPEIIQEIHKAGFNIHPTVKGQKSVLRNINFLKKHKLFITKNSTNLIKEIKSYQWKVDKENNILDEPVKINDDLIDSIFYALEDKARGNDFAVGGISWT
ncbi:MAG: PBSX family phage terminase large subunit [Promethearchaeia archaeon]